LPKMTRLLDFLKLVIFPLKNELAVYTLRAELNSREMSNRNGGRHTIVLIQQQQDLNTRTYTDHESVADAVRSIVGLYENYLRVKKPHGALTYDTKELFQYLDSYHDLSILAFDRNTKAYQPYDRTWIKNSIYQQLQRDQKK
jgi:hypothetical protein